MDLGSADIPLRFTRGNDVSFTVYVSGDRDAYAFAAKLKPALAANGTSTTAFTVTVGAYDSDSDETPVTCVMADTTTDGLTVVGRDGYVWDLKWTDGDGLERTVASGPVTVLDFVT